MAQHRQTIRPSKRGSILNLFTSSPEPSDRLDGRPRRAAGISSGPRPPAGTLRRNTLQPAPLRRGFFFVCRYRLRAGPAVARGGG
jgi:hypothetical protein